MIIRDGRTPAGRDVGPVQLFRASELATIGGGLGYGEGGSWRETMHKRIHQEPAAPASETRVVYPRRDPAGHEFKAEDKRQKWCSHQCQAREWYRAHQLHPRKGRPRATCHDRPHYAQGLCIPCYSRLRRDRVAQGISPIPELVLNVS